MVERQVSRRRLRLQNPWSCSLSALATTLLGLAALLLMAQSFLTKQLDVKGCEMSWMRPAYSRHDAFDAEHTRFANKYSLYLYREGGIDDDFRVKGVPVLFIPGNAGSYKQVRSLASEAAYHYHNAIRHDVGAGKAEKRPLDFFAVDFNEDITAFHGQTLLDQAEYLNDAIAYILSLYHTPGYVLRDLHLPKPTSVIIVGHSMGGVVARTMFTLPNFQPDSINTIITLAAPHARPPVSFDGDIVRIYKGVNDYWRYAYAQEPPSNNPLQQVTLISIAGGGLDTIISSDYASIESLVPESHGFTVFTSSMPNVWTGMDHLAITWCDQNRKSVIRALYDVIDVSQASQTVPVTDRMRGFKRWFLTGLEGIAEKSLPHQDVELLLTLDENNVFVSQDERLVIKSLGKAKQNSNVYLLPVTAPEKNESKFTLLTNEDLHSPSGNPLLEVVFCKRLVPPFENVRAQFAVDLDFSGNSSSAVKLACKSTASDVITLPASTHQSTFPFKTDQPPFSYLEYLMKDFEGFHFAALIDKASGHSSGWVIAEFSPVSHSQVHIKKSVQSLFTAGVSVSLTTQRPLVTDIKIPALQSSLLAYHIKVSKQSCNSGPFFTPLLRQYITDVYESKFFVNVNEASINLHGVSPYIPPALHSNKRTNGLSFQIWSDPTCGSPMEITLSVDLLGSLGKLWMRYRIVFAAFPILIVALVLRQQFMVYDKTGVFMSFAQGLSECLSTSIPLTLAALTFLSTVIAGVRHYSGEGLTVHGASPDPTAITENTHHELLLGLGDIFFWFLVPMFGLMCIALCVAVNYVALLLEFIFAFFYSFVKTTPILRIDENRTPASLLVITSSRQRLITTCVLLTLVSTVIPYHFAYVVLCLVQLATCVRSFRLAKDTRLDASYNFYNYTHSILILMLWILPINLPILVVWVRNLTIQWLTPFSTHHNVLSIIPFVLLVETLNTGRMIPRVHSGMSLFTNVFLFSMGAYAAVYGVTYAYILHHWANILCGWLVAVHFDAFNLSLKKLDTLQEENVSYGEMKKRP